MNNFFKIDKKIIEASEKAMEQSEKAFKRIDSITEYNQQKVLAAFIDNKVSENHLGISTGYGYGDPGRETLDKVVAQVFGGEDAVMRHTFTCGTHTLATALFGILRPGDTMLCATGLPYDTIQPAIGITGTPGQGSLKDLGVKYIQADLDANGEPDIEKIVSLLDSSVKMVYIQRSRGYSLRPSLSVAKIGEIAKAVKAVSNAVIMVDNCYGEFVEETEPLQVGVDLIAGSLIKNPGGGIAPCGGYIAGKKEYVELCTYRMTTPGLGREVGATLGQNRNLFMGFFSAPHVTGEALKTAEFTASLFNILGYDVTPKPGEVRADIIQSVLLKNEEALVAFCQGMQKGAPVDSYVTPEPWDMPGYDSKVIMAAGAFTLGSSIELSADAPLREPYAAWMQGGLNFHSGKTGVMLAAQAMFEKGLIV